MKPTNHQKTGYKYLIRKARFFLANIGILTTCFQGFHLRIFHHTDKSLHSLRNIFYSDYLPKMAAGVRSLYACCLRLILSRLRIGITAGVLPERRREAEAGQGARSPLLFCSVTLGAAGPEQLAGCRLDIK